MAGKPTTRRGKNNPARRYQRTTRGKPAPAGSARGRPGANSRSAASNRGGARNTPVSTVRHRRRPSLLRQVQGLFARLRRPAPPPGRAVRGAAKPPSPGMSLDRKLDLAGVFMLFAGLLTFLSLLSSRHNIATGGWLSVLGRLFGWGGYLFPVGLAAVGLWLVLRSFERIPRLDFERLVGLILLFLNILGWLKG